MKVSHGVSQLQSRIVGSTLGSSQFIKRPNYVKTVSEVNVLNLGTLSYDAYVCTRLCENISKDFRVTKRTRSAY